VSSPAANATSASVQTETTNSKRRVGAEFDVGADGYADALECREGNITQRLRPAQRAKENMAVQLTRRDSF
jgi:hypothetical protein